MPQADRAAIMAGLAQAVLEGSAGEARDWARQAVTQGVSPLEALDGGLMKGIKVVETGFVKGELFLPELIQAGAAMKSGLEILEEELKKRGLKRSVVARVVFGTVKTDLHDIGKSIVSSVMAANGFEVVDAGVDVAPEAFVEKVRSVKPRILALSALLTTSVPFVKATVDALAAAGLRSGLVIVVGGSPLNEAQAKEAGCDLFGMDAIDGVRKLLAAVGVK